MGILRDGACGFATALVLAIAPTLALAEQSGSPPSGSPLTSPVAGQGGPDIVRHGDWELICRSPAVRADAGASDKETSVMSGGGPCRISQRLAVKASGETVFLVNVLAAKQSGQQVVVISTPLGGYLVPGLELRIDNGRPVRVLYETCNSSGCHGGFAMSGAIRAGLLGGKQLKVRIWTTKSEPVDVGVSLNGFAAAVKAMTAAQSAEVAR